MRRILVLGAALALALFGLTGPLDYPLAHGIGPATAAAIDLFGSDDDDDEKEKPLGAFWRTDSGITEARPMGIPTSFADLAERVAPAVVSIQTKGVVKLDAPSMPGFPPGFGLPPWHRGGDPFERRSEGEGSGFVVSPDGYIVTNNHVVEHSDEITVRFVDGSERSAEVVGLDPKTDVALLKVDPGDDELATIALGDSEAIRPGDWVVAIGNPFGFEHTVTAGIVSAKNRRQITPGSQTYDDYIQTDAAINPGNSGGPLIDLEGRVVGINTLVQAGANTIGFSIPINQAKQILPQLRVDGYATRGWLGVSIQPVTKDLADAFELDDPRGALVAMVMEDTPAAKGGIETGDVIVEFDGHDIEEWQDLPLVVANTPVDKQAKVVLIRNGKKKTIKIRTGRLEEDARLAENRPKAGSAEAFGLRAQDVTPEVASRLGLDDVQGVLVTEVDPSGAAAEAGIRRGDIIVELDRKPVEDAADLRDKLEGAERPLLLVRRGESTLWVRLKKTG